MLDLLEGLLASLSFFHCPLFRECLVGGRGIGQKLLSDWKPDIVTPESCIAEDQKVPICYTDALEAKRTIVRRYDKGIVCGKR